MILFLIECLCIVEQVCIITTPSVCGDMTTEYEARACLKLGLAHFNIATWQELFDTRVVRRDNTNNIGHFTPYLYLREPPAATVSMSMGYFDPAGALVKIAEGDGANIQVSDDGTTLRLSRAQLEQVVDMHDTRLQEEAPTCHSARPMVVQCANPLTTFVFYHTLADTEPLRTELPPAYREHAGAEPLD